MLSSIIKFSISKKSGIIGAQRKFAAVVGENEVLYIFSVFVGSVELYRFIPGSILNKNQYLLMTSILMTMKTSEDLGKNYTDSPF